MRIFILGATGRVGSVIVNQALHDGHEVTALVRQPDKVLFMDRRLTLIQGNARNREDVSQAIREADVVISALGTDGTTTLSEFMKIIIDEMNLQGIKRIVTVGTAGILQSRVEPELYRYQSSESRRRSTTAAEEHQRVYEMLNASNLDWTIVCPTYLPDGEAIGNYRVERDYLPEDGVSISVGDTAEFTYQQIFKKEYIGTRVGIAY
ncbi:SDR family oxidoreductase [Paenibacillus sp. PR3]|uniref:SDR family oxidoreductase n=1 Tax=Paenibacillus terricola TaxID=2763503 RepID=A0ABR8MW98_9BACL|nr:SDR family oxidoreductase [Paenibacillus terricola]MBD3919267.1 SDR family oxidoreductase [Paenibacillus terricola]